MYVSNQSEVFDNFDVVYPGEVEPSDGVFQIEYSSTGHVMPGPREPYPHEKEPGFLPCNSLET